jgi:outer membrane biogenesis lipoprotein LolB
MRTFRTGAVLVSLAACALLGGCGRSAASRAQEAADRAHSWRATLALLEREQARGAVSARFAEQVRRAAEEELRKAGSP